jgi:hypothetical protein
VDNDPPPWTQEAESNGDKNTDGQGTTGGTQDSEKEWGEGVEPHKITASRTETNFGTQNPSKKLRMDKDRNKTGKDKA